ncbi:MAG TPA: 5-oxoprolinase subunit PxpA [Chthoniobacterales bacterium]|nr:5-oxoprolinase subunit PxpA [Chthoniobacterales bacterium]
MRVDLNADLGEGAGHDDELLELVSSASIACGFHAGDPVSILASIRAARARGVAVGAHPSFADRENFGRKEIALPAVEVFALVAYQLGAFRALATAAGTRVSHVKAHGALYNMAVHDEKLAEAIAHAVLAVDSSLLFFAPGESVLERAGQSAKLRVVREVFADRNYLADGSLVPRTRPDALLHDPEEAAVRVLRMLREGVVRSVDGKDVEVRAETICVHGDTPGAAAFVRALRASLENNGVSIQAPQPTP